jgi:hydroxyethylthiazole kinase-like uncharacterized protein yjeF
MKILTAREIRQVDRLSTEQYRIPGILLMENAGMRVVEALEARFDSLEERQIAILCGKGNNGGDGLVAARQLLERGSVPSVFLFGDPSSLKGDALTNLEILNAIGQGPTAIASLEDWERVRPQLGEDDLLIDALFGTGLSKPLTGHLGAIVASLRDHFPKTTIVSVDVPSGCSSDGGRLEGPAVDADLTVTLTAPKPCLVLPPASEMAGEVIVADIGSPRELVESDDHTLELLTEDAFPAALIPRAEDTHKGDFGNVLLVGGSRGKSGAIAMAAEAALRSGAGLVTAAVPTGILPVVAGHMAEVMTEPLAETAQGGISGSVVDSGRLDELLAGKDVFALGPGIGRDPETSRAVREMVGARSIPVVLDADGINAFQGRAEELGAGDSPLVLTPHPGELARLLGCDTAQVQSERLRVARRLGADHAVYVVLKGYRTVVACPDGRAFINPTGNAGMATAGSGDVLTGMIAGVLGQPHLGGFEERLCLAVYLHGLAGDIAAAELGLEVMTARDLIRFLPAAWTELRGE